MTREKNRIQAGAGSDALGSASGTTRRRFLSAGGASVALASGVVLVPASVRAALRPTPPQTLGPFYPDRLPLDDDNDLIRVAGRSGIARGRITHVFGRVLDPDGRPVPEARVEIWQCDADGVYHHPLDGGGSDRNFQGWGKVITRADGRWRFRTIEPVPYGSRTPHIHFLVTAPGGVRLVTQLYKSGHPMNEEDFVLRRVPVEQRGLVISDFHEVAALAGDPEGTKPLGAEFDIVLNLTPPQS